MLNPSEQLVQQLKVLADLTRMRLLALCRQGECTVSELTEVIGQSQPRISQHLRALVDVEMLARNRDGKHVYYRVPTPMTTRLSATTSAPDSLRQLLSLLPENDRLFEDDRAALRAIRGEELEQRQPAAGDPDADRAVFRAIIDLTVTAPVGAVLDIGCGRGQILKLLASRASRAVGLDIDAGARRLARAELMLADLPNCRLQKGDMYRLPFINNEFDTIILDDVLGDAKRPVKVLSEASRVLKPGGRLLILLSLATRSSAELKDALAAWCATAHLRLSPARIATKERPTWMLAVATIGTKRKVAA